MSIDPSSNAGDSQPFGAAARNRAVALTVIIAARNEADRIGATIEAVAAAAPYARLIVAEDSSTDETAQIARAAGAEVISGSLSRGKGANVTAAAQTVLERVGAARPGGGKGEGEDEAAHIVLLCDGDLGQSAAELPVLARAVERGDCDLAVAAFTRRVGGGVGIARGAGRWAIYRLCGLETNAPLSGQRAMRLEVLQAAVPFAGGFGMEVGMTVDAVRAGYRVIEVGVDLEHRATGRTLAGFVHRGRQLRDIGRAYISRRGDRRLQTP